MGFCRRYAVGPKAQGTDASGVVFSGAWIHYQLRVSSKFAGESLKQRECNVEKDVEFLLGQSFRNRFNKKGASYTCTSYRARFQKLLLSGNGAP